MCKSIPLDAPWTAKNAQKWDQISLAKWLNSNTLSKPAHDLLDTAIAGCYTSAASEVSMLWMLYPIRVRRRPELRSRASRTGRKTHGWSAAWARSTGPMAAEIGDAPAPVATRPADRAGRGRGDCARRRHDGAGAPGRRGGAAGHRQPDHLRADAADGPDISSPADAQRRDLQDQRRVRRAVLARRWSVGAVGGTRLARDGHHRRLHRQGAARRAVRDRRGPDRPRARASSTIRHGGPRSSANC